MVVLASLVSSLRGWRSNGAFQLGSKAVAIKIVALAFGIVSIVNLAWPRTPEAGWFANWLIVISLAVILFAGLIQMAKLDLSSNRLTTE